MTSILLTAALIIAAIVILCSLFNMLHKKQQKKQRSKRKKILYHVIKQYNLHIHQAEDINDCLFGIDKLHAKLLHLNFRNPQEELTLIDLHEVQSANLHNTESIICETRKDKAIIAEKYITKMELMITLKEPTQPPVMLSLYQYEDGIQNLLNFRRRGEYWQTTTNRYLEQLAGNTMHV